MGTSAPYANIVTIGWSLRHLISHYLGIVQSIPCSTSIDIVCLFNDMSFYYAIYTLHSVFTTYFFLRITFADHF